MRTFAKVYVITADDGTVKVGNSTDPARRAREIGRGSKVAYETVVIEHAELVERRAHKILALSGGHLRGEWFKAKVSHAVDAIDKAVSQCAGDELPLYGKLNRNFARTNRGEILLRIKADDAFLDMVDRLRLQELPPLSRADYVRRLVMLADRKLKK